MTAATQHHDHAFQRRIVHFVANAHRACPHCQAPGQYLSDDRFLENYPEIVDRSRDGQGVGPICPCCGGDRPITVERRSDRKEWWMIRLPRWMTRVMQFLDPK